MGKREGRKAGLRCAQDCTVDHWCCGIRCHNYMACAVILWRQAGEGSILCGGKNCQHKVGQRRAELASGRSGSNDSARSYLQDFEGGLDCRISSTDIYVPTNMADPKERKKLPFCPTRAALLPALSGGGRHGFEQPYMPLGLSNSFP